MGPRDVAVSFLAVCEGVSGGQNESVLIGFHPNAKPSSLQEWESGGRKMRRLGYPTGHVLDDDKNSLWSRSSSFNWGLLSQSVKCSPLRLFLVIDRKITYLK